MTTAGRRVRRNRQDSTRAVKVLSMNPKALMANG